MGAAVGGGGKGTPRSDINITPLVDIVLVLLIIFMVLTPLMEKEMGVQVPEDNNEVTPPPPPDEIPQQFVLRVKEDGKIFMNQEQLTDDTMVERLRNYYRMAKSLEAKQGKPVIFFDADDKTKYVRAVKALDAIREAQNGWVIGMMTEKIKGEEVPGTPAVPGAPGAPAPGTPAAPAAPAAPPQ